MVICPDCHREIADLKLSKCESCDYTIERIDGIPVLFSTRDREAPLFREYMHAYDAISEVDLESSIQPTAYLEGKAERLFRQLGDLRGRRVLEIGVGQGRLFDRLLRSEAQEVFGIDIAATYLSRYSQDGAARVAIANVENLPFLGQFDVVVAADVLEHVLSLPDALAGIHRSLAPGGTLVACVPHRENLLQYSHLLGCPYPLVHLRTFNRQSLKDALEGAGFSLHRIAYDGFIPGRERRRIESSEVLAKMCERLRVSHFGKLGESPRIDWRFGSLFIRPMEILAVATKRPDVEHHSVPPTVYAGLIASGLPIAEQPPKRLVSLTPIKVTTDSRTFKEATTAANLGYTSTVVEGLRSPLDPSHLPFALISVTSELARTTTHDLASISAIEIPGQENGTQGGEPAPSPQNSSHAELAGNTQPVSLTAADLLHLACHPHELWRRLAPVVVRDWIWRVRHPRAIVPALHAAALSRSNILWYLHSNLTVTAPLIPDADCYYLHSISQFLAVQRRCREQQVPYVYDAHDYYSADWVLSSDSGIRDRFLFHFFRVIEASCVRRAAAVVTVSDGVAGLIERRYGRKPIVIRNAHDLRLDEPVAATIRQHLGLADEVFLVVMSGNDKRARRVDAALEALKLLPDEVMFAFLGARNENYVDLAREAGLSHRAHFIDPVPPTQVVPFIRDANASAILYSDVNANVHYALPNGFFHAIGAGLPLLYPQLPEIVQIARHHELGIPIDARDPRSIADGIFALRRDPEKAELFRHNSERARIDLSWEHEELTLAALLAETLSDQVR